MSRMLFSFFLILSTIVLNAQTSNDLIKILRSDIKSDRKTVIIQSMNFTKEEADAFWPVYKDFEAELEKLSDDRLNNITDYAVNYDSMTNEKAIQVISNSIKFHQARLKLNEIYFQKYLKVLPPITAAKYIQLEYQMQTIVDMMLINELPLVKIPENKD